MKGLRLSVIFLVSILFYGCGSIPQKSSVTPGTGILAIAKSYSTEVSFPPGWATEIQIEDASGNVVGKSITLYRVTGKQFVFLKDLQPGNYKVARRRSTIVSETGSGALKPWRPMSLSFTIQPDKVTVLPRIFDTKAVSKGHNSGSSRLRINSFDKDELPVYVELMKKYNKKGEWDVVWSDGKPFVNRFAR